MTEKINFVQAVNFALHDAMEANQDVLVLGEDVGDEQGGGVLKATQGLSTSFGKDRVRSTPIAEEAIVGAAVGAAVLGKRPVAEIMLMNFVTVAMDQMVNHAAKLRYMSGGQTTVPLTIRTMTGAGAGAGGQHSDMLEAWFAHVAGMKVVAASTPADAYGLLRACIEDDDPCLFIENLPTYWSPGLAPERGKIIPLGKANVEKVGTDLTLISYARSMMECRQVVKQMQEHGVSIELIDLRTIAPFDIETILISVQKTKRAVIVHEAPGPFGVGAEISSKITESLFSELEAPIRRVCGSFNPVPYAQVLESAHIPRVEKITQVVREVISKK